MQPVYSRNLELLAGFYCSL